MSVTMPSPTAEEFAEWVHDALNRLYDSPYLRSHPLTRLVSQNGVHGAQPSQALRRILLDAISAVRPVGGVPAQSPDWRAYRILELRYIEGLGPAEVMQELGLARSQYFREQARVLDALTVLLWDQWQKPLAAVAAEKEISATREELAQLEIERLSAAAIWEPVELTGLLADLRPVLEPLARARNAVLRFLPSRSITVRHADRVLMRQTLLHLLTHALETARGGEVEVQVIAESHELGIRVAGMLVPGAGQSATVGVESSPDLEVCQQLMKAMGGRLQVEITPPGSWAAFLAWPDVPSPVLLIIDDNTGFLALFRRYLTEHGWRVIGATSGAEAWSMIAKTRPNVIILDIMMPKEDGWDVLMKLKAAPETMHIPVLVCSVLNEPQLAQSLGAAGYLPKPVTQDALLQALQPWSPGSAIQVPGC